MIRRLRARHRAMTAAMAALSLGGLGAAVAARPPALLMPALPAPLQAATQPGGRTPAGEPLGAVSWPDLPIQAEVYSDAVVLTPREPLRAPDPLLYWVAAPPGSDLSAGLQLPPDARLLGPFADDPGQRFALPAPGGALVLYSLGHGRVLGALPLEGAP